MDIMQDYMQHRGWVIQSGSNTAIVSEIPNEHRVISTLRIPTWR